MSFKKSGKAPIIVVIPEQKQAVSSTPPVSTEPKKPVETADNTATSK